MLIQISGSAFQVGICAHKGNEEIYERRYLYSHHTDTHTHSQTYFIFLSFFLTHPLSAIDDMFTYLFIIQSGIMNKSESRRSWQPDFFLFL